MRDQESGSLTLVAWRLTLCAWGLTLVAGIWHSLALDACGLLLEARTRRTLALTVVSFWANGLIRLLALGVIAILFRVSIARPQRLITLA